MSHVTLIKKYTRYSSKKDEIVDVLLSSFCDPSWPLRPSAGGKIPPAYYKRQLMFTDK